jgi:hypothetical protein
MTFTTEVNTIIKALEDSQKELRASKENLEDTLNRLNVELKQNNQELARIDGALQALTGESPSPSSPESLLGPSSGQESPGRRVPSGLECSSCGAFEVYPVSRTLNNGRTVSLMVCGECSHEAI